MSKDKKRVGIFSFACDEGCTVMLAEILNTKLIPWLEKIEIVYFLALKEKEDISNLDIAVIEGVINTEEEKKELLRIRENSKVVIAMGSCAINAQPSGQRNLFNESQNEEIQDKMRQFNFLPKALAIKEVVKVEDQVGGCPIMEEKFVETFEKYL